MCSGGPHWGYRWKINRCPKSYDTGDPPDGVRWVYDKNVVCERCLKHPELDVNEHFKYMKNGFCIHPKKISCDHECAKAAKKECPGKPWYSSISDSSSAGIQIDLISILILVEQ